MRKLRTIISFVMLIASAVLLCRCTHTGLAGGGTEDVNTKVAGLVFNPGGAPAAHAQVLLIAADYDPVRNALDTVLTDTTNDAGEYRFVVRKPGLYNLQIVDIVSRTRAMVSHMSVGGATAAAPAAELMKPGTVRVMTPPNANPAQGYMFIPGTTVYAYLQNTSGFVMMDSVPVDMSADIAYSTTNNSSSTILRFGVHVTSGDTAVVWNSGWNYSRTITLNTSSSGAGVTGSVVNFPVLIRLTTANFDFTQARNNGEDIRFAKPDNTFRPYEIERWDAVAGLAEVWVKVDTVFGNDSGQTITMYWGNIDAPAQSNSVTVFDTASGFQAVWHLGENNDSVFDATGDSFNGKNTGAGSTAGMIGKARDFSNGNYIKIPGLLNTPGSITLSAWVRSTSSNQGQEVVSLGDNALLRLDDSYQRGTSGWYHNSTTIDTSFAVTKSGRMLANTGWHFVAYSIDTLKNVQTLYIDGVQSATTNDVNPINYKGLGKDTYIGIHGNGKTYFNFIGQIDEVRVNNVPLDPDWIKLCFMNQKEQDALVKW